MDFDTSDNTTLTSLTTTPDNSDDDFKLEISSSNGENIDNQYLVSNLKIV